MVDAVNSQNAIKKRKCQDTVKLCGNGMIVFAFWSIAKFLLRGVTQGLGALGDTTGISMSRIIFAIVFVIAFAIFDFLLRAFVWHSSMKEAEGKKAGNLFIVIVVLMLIYNLAGLVLSIISGPQAQSAASFVMELIIDATDDFLMAALLYKVSQLRKLTKLAAREA